MATTSGIWVNPTAEASKQELALPTGATLVGADTDGGTLQEVADNAKPMQSYVALQTYAGRANGVRITSPLISGTFQRDDSDTTSADNGGTVIVDASGRRWRRLFDGRVNVRWFGATGDGTTDDTAAEDKAIQFCAQSASWKTLFYPAGTYVRTAPYAFTTAHIGLRFQGEGKAKSIIKKMFAGNLGTVFNCQHISASGIQFDGNCSTYAGGKGFIFSGYSHYPTFDETVMFYEFGDAALEFGPDSGFRACIRALIFSVTPGDYRSINITGPDTTAMFRNLSGTSTNGYVQVTGALDTEFNSGYCSRMVIDATSSITKSIGTVWSSSGVPIVINGLNTIVIGCRLAADVTLASGMRGAFIGNVQTVAGFTNNSTPGDVVVHHHPPSVSYDFIGRHKYSIGMPAGEFQVNVLQSAADADYTWLPDSSPTLLGFSTPFTANRTLTLSTTNVRSGMTLRVVRNGGNTGGPWSLVVGSTSKSLLTGQWCDVLFNGSFWLVTAFGSL